MRGNKFVVALGAVALTVCAACSPTVPQTQAPPPQIPKSTPPTTPSRIPVMVDRPALPDDCELVVPVEVMNPFRNIDIGSGRFDPAYLESISPMAAVAVGLALRYPADK